MENNNCTYSGMSRASGTSCLTIDTLREMMRKIPTDPFEQFANEHGMSLDNGDSMIFPEGFAELHNIPDRKGVIRSKFLDCSVLLIKSSTLGFKPMREYENAPQIR